MLKCNEKRERAAFSKIRAYAFVLGTSVSVQRRKKKTSERRMRIHELKMSQKLSLQIENCQNFAKCEPRHFGSLMFGS